VNGKVVQGNVVPILEGDQVHQVEIVLG
jgi:hypothetical protein